MEPRFNHVKLEPEVYKLWESGNYFAPNSSSKKPFTMVLPPPNASGKMHMGNVLMIAIEDLLIRWHRMMGEPTLWIPGTDHAGFETQVTYERELKKQDKSRFDFDRQTLYQNIWEFVQNNKSQIESQIRQMGASVDWSRYTFTLDPQVISTVYATFEKMFKDGLVYRDSYMVNYCTKCGTTFADLEIKHEDRIDPLYFIRYPILNRIVGDPEWLVVTTVRPEPIMVDTHLAVNPKDSKNSKWIGREVSNPLTGKTIQIIGDSFVDPDFGTGVVKMTPGHDKTDFDVAIKHKIPVISVIGMNGKLTEAAGEYSGLGIKAAREAVVAKLKEKNLIEKIDDKYLHAITICYKAGHDIEPMVLPNWFIKVESLKKPALDAVKTGKIKIYPKWREITYTKWMDEMHDWPISRQVVWGIRIPVWYNVDKNPDLQVTFLLNKQVVSGKVGALLKKYTYTEIERGLQTLIAPSNAKFEVSIENPGKNYLQETDTFDTWFSSGHWPLVTLHYPGSVDFKLFYPTSVLETGWEIIRFWVSRMIMFGIYLTGEVPFHSVYLHGLVRALDGRKMSKSLGNVINPDEYINEYGVDALRMGLISGTANGKDFAFPKDKILAYRNFTNKIWNMARFFIMIQEQNDIVAENLTKEAKLKLSDPHDIEILKKMDLLIGSVNESLLKFRFSNAGESIYHFMWDDLASIYLESIKGRKDINVALSVYKYVFFTSLKLLHPFMPFVTEAVWQNINTENKNSLIIEDWPKIIT